MLIVQGTAVNKAGGSAYGVKRFTCQLECTWCGKRQICVDAVDTTGWYNNVLAAITCRRCGRNQSGKRPAKPNFNGYTRKAEPWTRK